MQAARDSDDSLGGIGVQRNDAFRLAGQLNFFIIKFHDRPDLLLVTEYGGSQAGGLVDGERVTIHWRAAVGFAAVQRVADTCVVDIGADRDGLAADELAAARADLQQICEIPFHLAEVQRGNGGHAGIRIVHQSLGLGRGDKL